jgi:hypothetical protein
VLDLEFRLIFSGIRAASQNASTQCPELLDGVTKLGRFVDSTGCIRFGIEIENEIPLAIIGERHDFAVIRRDAKVGSLIAFFQHAALSLRSLALRFCQHPLQNIAYRSFRLTI